MMYSYEIKNLLSTSIMRANNLLTVQGVRMNRHIVFSMCLLACASCVHAADLAKFDDIRAKYQNYRDPTRLSYLYNRCAALQLNVSALLERKGQKAGAKDFENLAQHYMILSEANEREIDKKRGQPSKETIKTVHRNVGHVSEIYSKRLRENFAKRGEYIIGDAQLESELAECNLPDEFKKRAMGN